MKLFIAVLGLFASSLSIQSQSIPEGAEGIELTTTLSDSALFESTLSFLEDEGFGIETADEDQGSIVTEYKTAKDTKIRILATVDHSIVLFKGQGAAESASTNEPLTYQATTTEVSRTGFIRLNEVIDRYAKTLNEATVEYIMP